MQQARWLTRLREFYRNFSVTQEQKKVSRFDSPSAL
jgi:hypothetical protein